MPGEPERPRLAQTSRGVNGLATLVQEDPGPASARRVSLIGRFVFENKTTRKSVGALSAKENEGIVVAVHRPWA